MNHQFLPCLFTIRIVCLLTAILLCIPRSATADSFCGEVLNTFDFNQGVFAGPDPDLMPNQIEDYVRQLADDHVKSGALPQEEADYFLKVTLNDPDFHLGIARTCRTDPKADWMVLDRQLMPLLKPDALVEHRRVNANRTARAMLEFLYSACQAYWIDTGGMDACSLRAVIEGGPSPVTFHMSPGIEVKIKNGTMEGFQASAWHLDGDRTYSVNAEGRIVERQKPGF